MNKIYVIGIGYKPLEKRAGKILFSADSILASHRLFEVFKGYEEFKAVAEKVNVINKVDETVEFIRNNYEKQSIVLLASGDPMFFGIGRRVVAEFGGDCVEIIPDLSSVQCAFSKIREAWDDAFLMSLHGGPDPEKRRRLPFEIDDIPLLLRSHKKIAILTDTENNPSAIAKRLLSFLSFILPSSLKMFVCERLGYLDEKIISGRPEEIASMTFSGPNVVILLGDAEALGRGSAVENNMAPAFGLTEAEIAHSRGLITKDEVRAISLHKLRMPQRGTFWDIGAGSGSVSLEAARLFPGLRVYAVERDEEQLAKIEENRISFGVMNITVTRGVAPEALSGLPSPDRVFIGGSGRRLSEIIHFISESMTKGIVVINAVTIETLNEATSALEKKGFETEISQISVARSKLLNGQSHMSALNPVFVVKGERR